MSIKLPRPLLFIFSFLLLLFLYWPSLTGTPIWDDLPFWFADSAMKPGTFYSDIWLRYAWPFSVSVQKLLLAIGKKHYFFYHLFNFGLHFTNSFLVYHLGRVLRFRYPFLLFLLFLLHPANVITTAWMIQIKTLLCFFFGLSSLMVFLKGQKSTKWMALSWILFALSVLSKSASIPLPLIFLIFSFKKYRFSKLHLLLPFFLIAAASTHRVLRSEVTKAGSEKAVIVNQAKEQTAPKVKAIETKKQIIVEDKSALPVPAQVPEKKDNTPSFSLPKVNGDLILQTLNYYFWQVLLPFNTAPVKGLNEEGTGFPEYLHVFFLLSLVLIFKRDTNLYYLSAAHILLLPFLGFMPAPYMAITWVSDQHLYLVLPLFLFFWMSIIEKMKGKFSFVLPLLLCAFFSYKTFVAAKDYKDERAFFESSLNYNPTNLPIAYNLAFNYLLHHDVAKAHALLETTIELAKTHPSMRNSIYFKEVVSLYIELQGMIYED